MASKQFSLIGNYISTKHNNECGKPKQLEGAQMREIILQAKPATRAP